MAGTLGISSATRKKAAGGGQSLSGTQQRTTGGNLMSTAENWPFDRLAVVNYHVFEIQL